MDVFNQYGRCTLAPIDMLQEAHGRNLCCIFLYELHGGWLYGYDIIIGNVIANHRPLLGDTVYKSALNAKYAAKKAIFEEIKSSRKAKKIFEDFQITNYEQLELF
ncbi:MAG: hypothetical protein IJ191_00530 [Treponema sp.]|nr:hypothetical protein [Treponema sp.]